MSITAPRFKPALSNLLLIHQGKTRDTYEIGEGVRLIVATDRLSTHDVIHESPVPRKGEVLTALTIFWIERLLNPAGINNHLVACGPRIHQYLNPKPGVYPVDLSRRAIVVRDLKMIPVEFIYRAYLTGSLWKKFYSKGLPNPYGVELPSGLSAMSKFDQPIFTPTEKSATDDPLEWQSVQNMFPEACDIALQAFEAIRRYLRLRQIELVDSKFELGVNDSGRICLADEIVTPDSSRFCDLSKIQLGKEPPWLDKQIARDEAERIWGDGPKRPLKFSDELVENLSETYLDIFGRITGMSLDEFWQHRFGFRGV